MFTYGRNFDTAYYKANTTDSGSSRCITCNCNVIQVRVLLPRLNDTITISHSHTHIRYIILKNTSSMFSYAVMFISENNSILYTKARVRFAAQPTCPTVVCECDLNPYTYSAQYYSFEWIFYINIFFYRSPIIIPQTYNLYFFRLLLNICIHTRALSRMHTY